MSTLPLMIDVRWKGQVRKIHLHGALVYEDCEFIGREGRVI